MNTRDAVIHFQGFWPTQNPTVNKLVYRKVGDLHHWGFWGDTPLNTSWEVVCTREEFEAYDYANIDKEPEPSPLQAFADSLLDQFYTADAPNFLEYTLENKEAPHDSFVITMQRSNGKTPAELLTEKVAEVEQLKLQLKKLRKPYDFDKHVSP